MCVELLILKSTFVRIQQWYSEEHLRSDTAMIFWRAPSFGYSNNILLSVTMASIVLSLFWAHWLCKYRLCNISSFLKHVLFSHALSMIITNLTYRKIMPVYGALWLMFRYDVSWLVQTCLHTFSQGNMKQWNRMVAATEERGIFIGSS